MPGDTALWHVLYNDMDEEGLDEREVRKAMACHQRSVAYGHK